MFFLQRPFQSLSTFVFGLPAFLPSYFCTKRLKDYFFASILSGIYCFCVLILSLDVPFAEVKHMPLFQQKTFLVNPPTDKSPKRGCQP